MLPQLIDFSRQADYAIALLPEIVLSLWAMGVLLIDVFQKGSRSEPSRPMIAWLAFGGLVAAAIANGLLIGVGETAPVGAIALDNFRIFVNFVFLLAAGLAILLSIGYLDRHGINRGEFYALLLFAVVGMMVMASARDLILIFLALELMSVAIYVLVGFKRDDPRSIEASLKYFLLGAFSSGFFLFGIALIFGATATTRLPTIAGIIAEGGLIGSPMLISGVALLAVGFAFKVAAVPFHVWTPDAYDGAATPVTALMATGVKAAAFATFIRVFPVTFIGLFELWAGVLWWLAVLTMFGANLVALTQGSVKRMLAYSSIAHAGYLLVALLSANAIGTSAFLFYVVVYTLMTAGAFGIVIANAQPGRERMLLEDYEGFGWQQPVLGAALAILLLSLAGFPLTAGFIGKLFILRGALEAGHTTLAIALVMASLVSYFYYLRLIVIMYMRPAPSEDAYRDVAMPLAGRAVIVFAAAAVIVLFFWPTYLLFAAQVSVAHMFVTPDVFLGLGK
jgi:NADH-quinone oxidoreductase subunit N